VKPYQVWAVVLEDVYCIGSGLVFIFVLVLVTFDGAGLPVVMDAVGEVLIGG
jgi:hypothetical protein